MKDVALFSFQARDILVIFARNDAKVVLHKMCSNILGLRRDRMNSDRSENL